MNFESVTEEYKKLYCGIREIECEIDLHIQDDAIPKGHPPRRVPHAAKEKLKQELDKMENNGIIVKVTKPTDLWNRKNPTESKRSTFLGRNEQGYSNPHLLLPNLPH